MDSEPKRQEPDIPPPVPQIQPDRNVPEIPPDIDTPEKRSPVQARKGYPVANHVAQNTGNQSRGRRLVVPGRVAAPPSPKPCAAPSSVLSKP